MESFESDLRDQLSAVYHDGRWICVTTMLAQASKIMTQVADVAGFDRPMTDAERRVSPLIGLAVHDVDADPEDGFPIVSLELPSSGDLLADVLGTARSIAALPTAILEQLDAWDPDRTARVLLPPILSDEPMAGRTVFGGRPLSWVALEDKLAVLDVFASAGIPAAPAEVVSLVGGPAVAAAHQRLAGAHGTVWAVDNSKGMHGGAAGTHWVASTREAVRLSGQLAGDHERVRIMPFLNGVPCSIHGIVLEGATVTTRPNEMLMYVNEADRSFHYCRFGNHWDPPPADREAMRVAAAAVGDTLRRLVDFRGVFSLDGVLTEEGFRPTEINPRYGMALPFQLPTADGGPIDLLLLDKAIIAGVVNPDPGPLRQWLLAALDGNRQGGAMFATTNRPDQARSGTVLDEHDHLRVVASDDIDTSDTRVLASVTWMPMGADQRLVLNFGEAFPIGPSAAPLALRIAHVVDESWNVGLARLTPAFSL